LRFGPRPAYAAGRCLFGTGPAIVNQELILIVEDQPLNRKLVRDVLQSKGYRTLESETAEEGLQLAREHLPALVLMDIQLPGMNGIEALKQLRADPATRAIPVIAVTASAMQQNRQEILSAGFDGYQPKPINIKVFLQAVREALDREPDAPPPESNVPL
jgi:CheY-like chemotaxis protein